MKDLFGDWLRSFGKEEKKLVVVGAAAVIWTIWNARSEICFEKKRIHDPFVLIHRVACFTNSWAILQTKQENSEEIIWGTKLLERVASEIFNASRGSRPGICRIIA